MRSIAALSLASILLFLRADCFFSFSPPRASLHHSLRSLGSRRHQRPGLTSSITSFTRPAKVPIGHSPPHHHRVHATDIMRMQASEDTGGPVEDSSSEESSKLNVPSGDTNAVPQPPASLWQRLRNAFRSPDDGLTFKERLAKYGIAAVLAYLCISNVGGCLAVAAAWYIFSATNHITPLAPGQWKGFLAIYSGFFVFLNVVRPLRFALAITIAPQFDRIIRALQRRFRASRPVAIAWTVALLNVCGSFAVLFAGLAVASLASGVPIWYVGGK